MEQAVKRKGFGPGDKGAGRQKRPRERVAPISLPLLTNTLGMTIRSGCCEQVHRVGTALSCPHCVRASLRPLLSLRLHDALVMGHTSP